MGKRDLKHLECWGTLNARDFCWPFSCPLTSLCAFWCCVGSWKYWFHGQKRKIDFLVNSIWERVTLHCENISVILSLHGVQYSQYSKCSAQCCMLDTATDYVLKLGQRNVWERWHLLRHRIQSYKALHKHAPATYLHSVLCVSVSCRQNTRQNGNCAENSTVIII